MIAGIGTDVVEVERIREKLSRSEHFRDHVFAADESAYCEKQKNPAMHFAARWAVKEAFLKAFGLKFIGNHRLPEIETRHDADGKPHLHLHGKTAEEFASRGFRCSHLSISHTEHYAVAFVLIEQ